MRVCRLPFALMLLAMVVAPPVSRAATDAPELDWLALGNGAVILEASSEYDDKTWSALGLIDGAPGTGWATRKGELGPNTIVMELARKVTLRRIVVDTRGVDGKGRGAGEFELWGSADSAGKGYSRLLAGKLTKPERKAFDVQSPVAARWLKLIVKNNQGDDRYTEIMEMEAYGDPAGGSPVPRTVKGVYDTNYGLLRLEQRDARIWGCYDHDGGVLNGDTDGRVLRFEWREVSPAQIGTAVMVLTEAGDRLNGVWYEHGRLQGVWLGTRVTDGRQPKCVIAANGGVEQALSEGGPTILYGIHFDLDSDRLRPDSAAVLGDVVEALKAKPDWRIVIEGYTDAQGGAEHNMSLSGRRAEAVKRWLVEHGVVVERLQATGYGESRPIADNATPQGQALNRRVELSLKK